MLIFWIRLHFFSFYAERTVIATSIFCRVATHGTSLHSECTNLLADSWHKRMKQSLRFCLLWQCWKSLLVTGRSTWGPAERSALSLGVQRSETLPTLVGWPSFPGQEQPASATVAAVLVFQSSVTDQGMGAITCGALCDPFHRTSICRPLVWIPPKCILYYSVDCGLHITWQTCRADGCLAGCDCFRPFCWYWREPAMSVRCFGSSWR